MKQAIFEVSKQLGIVLDQPPEEAPMSNWTAGENVAFRDGYTYRVGGYDRYASPLPTPTPLFAMGVIIGPDAYWIYATTNKVYVTNGVTHWDITPVGGLLNTEPGEWSGCLLNGLPCLNNGRNPPMYWNLNTATKCATLPGWPAGALCKALRATKYHLIALFITESGVEFPNQVWWSSGAQAGSLPAEWTPSASNDAGDVICGDTPGAILDGLALRDVFIVYKQFATYIMQYVAGQYVFTTRKLFLNSGIQALNCVVEDNGFHYVFTGTDVIRHDGQNFESLVDQKVKRTLVQSVNPAKKQICQVTSRFLNRQIWVLIPEANNLWLNKAYVIDTENGDVGIRLVPQISGAWRGVVSAAGDGNSWDADSNSWDSDLTFWDQQSFNPTQDSILMTDPVNSRLYSVDTSELADGAPVPSYVERLGAQLGDFVKHKVVTGIVPRIEGTPGDVLTFRLGGQSYFDQPISWGDPVPFVIGQSIAVSSIVEGRLLSLRIEGNTAGTWKLYKYAVKYAEQGEV